MNASGPLPVLDFATVMASSVHDMKNSLGAVLGGLDELQSRTQSSPDERQQIDHLRHQSRRLNGQLIQMLSIYRLQEAACQPNIQLWPLKDVLEDLYAEHHSSLAAAGITLQCEADTALCAYFDRELVIGVLDNALNNALRYARAELQLCASSWSYAGGSGLQIGLLDDGPGYPAAMCFEVGQPGQDLQFRQGRTGLGLYFCALVADLHRNQHQHGEVLCDNAGLNGGGRFVLRLP